MSKGLPLAKPHPKAQEVHSLAPSRGRAFLNLLTSCGMVPTGGWGRGRKLVKEEVTVVCVGGGAEVKSESPVPRVPFSGEEMGCLPEAKGLQSQSRGPLNHSPFRVIPDVLSCPLPALDCLCSLALTLVELGRP